MGVVLKLSSTPLAPSRTLLVTIHPNFLALFTTETSPFALAVARPTWQTFFCSNAFTLSTIGAYRSFRFFGRVGLERVHKVSQVSQVRWFEVVEHGRRLRASSVRMTMTATITIPTSLTQSILLTMMMMTMRFHRGRRRRSSSRGRTKVDE